MIVLYIVGESGFARTKSEWSKMRIEGKAAYVDKGGKNFIKGRGSLPEDILLKSLEVSGKIFFEKISCDDLKIKGDGKGATIVGKNISVHGSLKAEKISAEKVVVQSQRSTIEEVHCDSLKIFESDSTQKKSQVKVKKIVAKKVELENCEVEEIFCTDAFIGTNCKIGKLTVENDCEVAADSKIANIIRSQT